MQDINSSDMTEDDAKARRSVIDEKINAIGTRLSTEALAVESKRTSLEERWFDDLRQIYGKYDTETESKLKKANKSRLFIKATRPKCETWKSKVTDLLFPTDDKNWGMGATPVAELEQVLDEEPDEDTVIEARDKFNSQIDSGMRPEDLQVDMDQLNESMDKGTAARNFQDEANVAAKAMERECEDQLVEAKYSAAARKIISDGVDLGTGILKGPFDSGYRGKRWAKGIEVDPETNKETSVWSKIDRENDMPSPSFSRVDCWSFFPDPNATCIEEAEFTFERHILTAKDMRKWSRREGFDKDAIREILRDESKDTVPTYLTTLRAITLDDSISIENKYIVWEYRGSLQADEMAMLYEQAGDEDGMKYASELDPLEEISAVVYVCGAKVISFGISAFDSEENIYSVFNLVEDPTSIFGWGIPWLMRDSQRAQNAAWRMMMDNGNLAAGPQVVIDKSVIQPADGNWNLQGRKVWHRTNSKTATGAKPFETFEIESNQTEFANIITMAREFSDDETNLPSIVTGDLSASSKTTYGGTAILNNNANIIFKNAIRIFDDSITVTTLNRLFDWNMQFNPKDEIKGDTRIDARGSSVLLVREIQSQNMMIMIDRYAQNPAIAPVMKIADTFRLVVQSMNLNPDEITKSDDDIAAELKAEQERVAAEKAQGQGGMDPESIKLEIAKINADSRIEAEEIRRETALIRLADENNMQMEELQAKLGMQREQMASRERTQAAEIATKERWNQQKIKSGNDDLSTGTSLEG